MRPGWTKASGSGTRVRLLKERRHIKSSGFIVAEGFKSSPHIQKMVLYISEYTRDQLTLEYSRISSKSFYPTATSGSEESEDTLQHCSINDPVATTWLISLEQIRRDHPSAADYLFFMACIDRKDIPRDLLLAELSCKMENTIGTLNAYALITRRPAESALDLHRLVHLAI